MRFGIMEMQLGLLIPADGTPDQIATRVAAFEHAALTRQLAGAVSEPSTGRRPGALLPQRLFPTCGGEAGRPQAGTGLSYTLHLPLWSMEPSTPLTSVRQGSAQAAIDVINATRALEPLDYVIPRHRRTGRRVLSHESAREGARAHPCASSNRRRGRACNAFCARRAYPAASWPSRRLSSPSISPWNWPKRWTCRCAWTPGTSYRAFSGPIDLFEALERLLPRLAQIHLHDSPQWRPERPSYMARITRRSATATCPLVNCWIAWKPRTSTDPLIFELRVDEALASLDVIRRLRPNLPIE